MRQLLALKWRLLPLVIAAAVLCIPLVSGVLSRHHVAEVAQAAQSQLDKKRPASKIAGTPNRIVIPSLSIDLPVVPQSYYPAIKSWPVSASTANYATETALINNVRGQSLIYGHDIRSVFGPLLNLQPNAVAYVYTANGHIFKYSYTGFQDVSPRQTEIVASMANAPVGLNLITCSGQYFQYRHLMSFKLLQAS